MTKVNPFYSQKSCQNKTLLLIFLLIEKKNIVISQLEIQYVTNDEGQVTELAADRSSQAKVC